LALQKFWKNSQAMLLFREGNLLFSSAVFTVEFVQIFIGFDGQVTELLMMF
jgi:hypothetical protein